MRDKGESGWLSAIYHVIREGLLICQAALRQRLVSRRYPLPETGNPFVTMLHDARPRARRIGTKVLCRMLRLHTRRREPAEVPSSMPVKPRS